MTGLDMSNFTMANMDHFKVTKTKNFLKILPEYFSALYSMKHGSSSFHTWNT